MIKARVKIVEGRGRGVFADELVKKKTNIEKCHLLIIPFVEIGSFLERYVFEYNKDHVALALGNGSLYNHSENANAFCEIDDEKKILVVRSLRDIKKGEEITINYGYSAEDKKRFHIF